MKLFYSLLAVVLVVVGSNVHAMHGPAHNIGYSTTDCILLGVATGAGARLVTYAGKKQAGMSNGQSMGLGALVAGVAIVAAQGRQSGSFNAGAFQLLGAIVTFAATMYLFPTNDIDAPAVSVPAKR
jgi:hypothetical protein